MKVINLLIAYLSLATMGCVSGKATRQSQDVASAQPEALGTGAAQNVDPENINGGVSEETFIPGLNDPIDTSGETDAEARTSGPGNSTVLPALAKAQNAFLRNVVNAQATMTRTQYDHHRNVCLPWGVYLITHAGCSQIVI
jgi:hypothetical protein